ncbi:AAA family ATPase [Gammaproteobacteria bacterium]|nr:AAA family ATPase [Gammaproteobacteria bacterium]
MSVKVIKWLENLGLGQYTTAFDKNAIDWEILPKLDQETLKDIGVNIAGHRLRILKAASELAALQPLIAPAVKAKNAVETEDTPVPGEDTAAWARTPGERKPVTMLFADVVGSTKLTEKLDAEEAHERLYRATQHMCESVEHNCGTVCRFMGDGIMAMFGAPLASERHALEACRAAIDMQVAVSEYSTKLEVTSGTGLQIRVGLNSGEVVVLEVGDDPEHPEYDASGPTVPLAARMEQSARAGTIMMTEHTRALAEDLIDFEQLSDITVKGISEPIVVYELKGVNSATGPSDSVIRQPFVGRKSELAQFRGLMESCLESEHGQIVCVRGEAGIGKTRLVEELTRIAHDRAFNSHRALVLDFGAGKGQEAVPTMIRSLLDIAPGSSKQDRQASLERAEKAGIATHDHRVFLNDLLDLTQPLELRILYDAMDPQARKEGKRAAMVQILKNLARQSPIFIVVEDLHWADDNTLDYLARLTNGVADCSALMVFTSRVEGDPIDAARRAHAGETPIVTWDLSPLRSDEAAKLASDFIDASDSLAKRCIERAAGNPLFLKQLLLSVDKGGGDSVPDSIKSLVLSRLDQLSSKDKLALQAASVLGQRFEVECLRFLIDAPAYECRELIERHLLRPEGPLYLFAHALIQEGAYSSLLNKQRSEWHRRAAKWYAERDLILHAEHLEYAGDAAAPGAYCSAAREQFERFRPERALLLIRAGLKITPNPDGFELKCFEGELLRVLGSVTESIAVYENASKVASNQTDLCRALVGVSEGLELTEKHEQLLKVLGKAEALAKKNALNHEMAKILKLRAGVYFFKSEKEACLETSSKALHYAQESNSFELVAQTLSTMADAEYNRGHYNSAFHYFDQCIDLARKHGFGRALAANLPMRGFISHYRNDVEAKRADYDEAIEMAVKTHDLRSEVHALTGGLMWAEMGDYKEGMEWLDRGLTITRKIGSKLFEIQIPYFSSRLMSMQGDYSQARKFAQDALSVLRHSESGMTFRGPTVLGIYAIALDDPDKRHDILREAEIMLEGKCLAGNHLDFREYAMQACLQAGEWDEVDRHAQELEEYTASEPIPRCNLLIARGRALAAYGRGKRSLEVIDELRKVHQEASRVELKFALPEIEVALRSE